MLRHAFAALAAVAGLSAAHPARAHDGIHILDAYARASAHSAAVFLVMENHAAEDDTLIAAATAAAEKAALHTHREDANGVMQMLEIEGGVTIPAHGSRALTRGGDHIMLMGLTGPLEDGDSFTVSLTFARGETIAVEVTVDNARMPEGHGGHDHGTHGMPDGDGGGDGAQMQHGHAKGHDHAAAAPDTTGLPDAEAITVVMKAQFDRPEAPLAVAPVVVAGDHALAGWAQDGKGGRALLKRRDGQWVIVLCGGPDLRMPDFLAAEGVPAGDRLSALYNASEDALGADHVALMSSFEGVLRLETGH